MKTTISRICLAVFILLAIGFTIWRLKLVHDVDAELRKVREAGLPTSGAELNAYYKEVPNDQNAAVVMEQAFELLRKYPDTRSNKVEHLKVQSWRQPLTSEEMELMVGYVELNLNAMEKASEAIRLPECRYPMDLSWGAYTLLPHLQKLKILSLMEEFRAIEALEANQLAEATAATVSIFGMAATLDNEPLVISKLVRASMLNIAIATLERDVNTGGLSKTELTDLDAALLKAANTNQFIDALIGERAMMIPYFRMSWADIKRYSSGSENENEAAQEAAQAGPQTPGPRPLLFRVTGFFERDLRYYLKGMETNISLLRMPPPKSVLVSNVQEELSQKSRGNYYIFSSMLLPAMENTMAKDASSQAQVRTAQVALKIEQYRVFNGHLPVTLGELVPDFLPAVPIDPFDGQPLRFRHLTKGYVVYSVGRDGHDNEGRERPADAKGSDKAEYDITFTVER